MTQEPESEGVARVDVNLPLAERQKVEQDPDAWVDSLTDDEIADIIGPSWADEGAGHAA